jgi:hypothetical protein
LHDQQPIPKLIIGQWSQTIEQIADRILRNGQLSRLEHLHLVTAILSDYRVTDKERRQINLIFDELQAGRIKFIG